MREIKASAGYSKLHTTISDIRALTRKKVLDVMVVTVLGWSAGSGFAVRHAHWRPVASCGVGLDLDPSWWSRHLCLRLCQAWACIVLIAVRSGGAVFVVSGSCRCVCEGDGA